MAKVYIREKYLSKIRPIYHKTNIVKFITGIRGCGKSSILSSIETELKNDGINKDNIFHIDLNKRPYKSIKDDNSLINTIKSITSSISGTKYLLIDEMPIIKKYSKAIEELKNSDYSIFIVLNYSDSTFYNLIKNEDYFELKVETLSFDEYLNMKEFLGMKKLDIYDEFNNYQEDGGFPYTLELETKEEKKEYVKTILLAVFIKDIARVNKIRNRELFMMIQKYLINNFGSNISFSYFMRYLENYTNTKIKKDTIYRYIRELENSHILSKCSRFDIKTKHPLNGDEKYYLADLSLYYATIDDSRFNYGPILENIAYSYAKAKDYNIYTGRLGQYELDFVLLDKENNYSYLQVSRSIIINEKDSKGINSSEEKEYRPLENIKDGYSKYLLTLDFEIKKRNGIKHNNIVDFIYNNKNFD